MAFVTRFAPSPTGPLHLGHAYSALLAHDMALAQHGTFLLRIEDIDQSRCRPEWEASIYDDLNWLALTWPTPVLRQSERLTAYSAALDQLWAQGLLYPCTCTRRDIEAAMSAPQEGAVPQLGPDGVVYPGTCRIEPQGPRTEGVLRLNMAAALKIAADLNFVETGNPHSGQIRLKQADYLTGVGDFVIARRDMRTSYHLSVVLDDALQGVTHVIRGEDLFDATAIHVLLQHLLQLPTPIYHHHRLIRNSHGKRLAKRDDARALSKYRAEGASPADIRAMVGLPRL